MAIKTTGTTIVTVDSAQVVNKNTIDISNSNNHSIDVAKNKPITAIRKEYSIIGDTFYAGSNSSVIPDWLSTLIDNVVATSVSNGLTNYNTLVQDVRNAIDSIDVAKNTFVEEINFSSRVDGIVGSHLTTLNTTYDGKYATIVALDTVSANANYALASQATDLKAFFNADITSRITSVQQAYSSADQALANDITALTTSFTDQESNLAGTSVAVSGLQTYVGIDNTTSNPNGLGMLSRLNILEKQVDGVIEFTSDTYDVMSGSAAVDTSQLIIDALPYALWVPMQGAGAPTATTRTYKDYRLPVPAIAQSPILENTLYVNSAFTNIDTDKYYVYVTGVWSAITSAVFNTSEDQLRSAHVGDVYIQYSTASGAKDYVKSYKFIKSAVDSTSPYLNDSKGYGWSLVLNTDAQSMYTTALLARDMADGKISQFYAWGGTLQPADYKLITTPEKLDPNNPAIVLQAEISETVPAIHFVFWFKSDGILYRNTGSSTAQVWSPVPTSSGNGTFIAVGDMLVVLNPSDGDTTTYWFNGTSWQINGPSGIVSKSKFFVDLKNDVVGPYGHVANVASNLDITSKAYADAVGLNVESKFEYNSALKLPDGKYYNTGFGLNSSGITQVTDGLSQATAYDSEFWVNAERFILKSPAYPNIQAAFKVTSSGIHLGIENTEATRNDLKTTYDPTLSYIQGDIVPLNGSSYMAIRSVPANINITNTFYWQLFASSGVSYTGTTEYYMLTNDGALAPLVTDSGWNIVPQTPTKTLKFLWNYNKNKKSDNTFTNSAVTLVTQYVKDGRGILSINEFYKLSSSPVPDSTGTWSVTFPIITSALPYIMNKTETVYTDGSPNTYTYSLIAAKGDNGATSLGAGFDAIPAYRGIVDSNITYDKNEAALVLQSNTDYAIGMAYPAFNVEDNLKRTFSVSYKSSINASTGFYVWLQEYDSDMPAGKIAVASGAYSPLTQLPTRSVNLVPYVSDAAITTSYKTTNFTYVPSATAKWASILIFNWTGMGYSKLFIKAINVVKQGDRGSAILTTNVSIYSSFPTTLASNVPIWWNNAATSGLKDEIQGDSIVVTNTYPNKGWTHIYKYSGALWESSVAFQVDGNAIVTGTLSADALAANSVIANNITFKGSLQGATGNFSGDISGSNGTFSGELSLSSAIIKTPYGKLAPFIIKQIVGLSSNTLSDRNLNFYNLISPSANRPKLYDSNRLSHYSMDVELELFAVLDSSQVSEGSLKIYVSYDGAAYSLICTAIYPAFNNHTGTIPIMVGYTTRSTPWNTCKFVVNSYSVNSKSKLASLMGKLEVLNHQPSPYTSGSVRNHNTVYVPSPPDIGR